VRINSYALSRATRVNGMWATLFFIAPERSNLFVLSTQIRAFDSMLEGEAIAAQPPKRLSEAPGISRRC